MTGLLKACGYLALTWAALLAWCVEFSPPVRYAGASLIWTAVLLAGCAGTAWRWAAQKRNPCPLCPGPLRRLDHSGRHETLAALAAAQARAVARDTPILEPTPGGPPW